MYLSPFYLYPLSWGTGLLTVSLFSEFQDSPSLPPSQYDGAHTYAHSLSYINITFMCACHLLVRQNMHSFSPPSQSDKRHMHIHACRSTSSQMEHSPSLIHIHACMSPYSPMEYTHLQFMWHIILQLDEARILSLSNTHTNIHVHWSLSSLTEHTFIHNNVAYCQDG